MASSVSLADQLAARRTQLKKPETKSSDTSTIASTSSASSTTAINAAKSKDGGDDGSAAMAAIHHRVRAADLPSWYTTLADCTYPSVFLPLSLQEAQAMVEHYKWHTAARTKDTPFTNDIAKDRLASLVTRLTTVVADFKDGAFIKLSSRSPKDAVVASGKTREIFRRLLNESSVRDDNAGLIAINRAHILALHMHTATEMMTTLLASERIHDDLVLALEYPTQWDQQLVIRKWIDIPIQYEVRAFIYNDVLTCMCQYYHYCYFPDLVTNKSRVEQLVREYWSSIKHRVPLSPREYCMDFAVDLANQRVWIIEINPFGDYDGMGTSTAMFDKSNAHDRDILFGRSKPFEYRIETAQHTNVYRHMASDWRTLWVEEGLHVHPSSTIAAAPPTITPAIVATPSSTTITPTALPTEQTLDRHL